MIKTLVLANLSNQTKLLEALQVAKFFGIENVILIKPAGTVAQYGLALAYKEFGPQLKIAVLPEIEDIFSFLNINKENCIGLVLEGTTGEIPKLPEHIETLILSFAYPQNPKLFENLGINHIQINEKLPEVVNLALIFARE